MKLLIINDYGIEGGGAEIRIKQLVELLNHTPFFEEIHIIEHETGISKHPSFWIHKVNSTTAHDIIKKIIQEHKITHVQIHNCTLFPLNLLHMVKEFHLPLIFFAHDYWGFCGRRNLTKPNQKICKNAKTLQCVSCIGFRSYIHQERIKEALRLCDVGIAPSLYIQHIYEAHNILNNKWKIIPPWINRDLFISRYRKPKSETKIILFVGPLEYAKGIDLLIEAMNTIKHTLPLFEIHVVGEGQEKNNPNFIRITDLAKKYCLDKHLHFFGKMSLPELVKKYCTASISVTCPLWPEVFGQTWAQAISCGTPVVATTVGSIPELAYGKVSLVEPNPRMLGKAILTALDTQTSFILSPEDFSLDKNISLLEKLYIEILKTKSPKHL